MPASLPGGERNCTSDAAAKNGPGARDRAGVTARFFPAVSHFAGFISARGAGRFVSPLGDALSGAGSPGCNAEAVTAQDRTGSGTKETSADSWWLAL
jgi:hypothetical protein